MAVFSIEYFDCMKDYFHPNVATFIDLYTDDDDKTARFSWVWFKK